MHGTLVRSNEYTRRIVAESEHVLRTKRDDVECVLLQVSQLENVGHGLLFFRAILVQSDVKHLSRATVVARLPVKLKRCVSDVGRVDFHGRIGQSGPLELNGEISLAEDILRYAAVRTEYGRGRGRY